MKSLADLRNIREAAKKKMGLRENNYRVKIVVGMGTSGIATGAREVMKTFLDEIATLDINDVIVTQTGEKGLSSKEPVVDIIIDGKETVSYGNVDVEIARQILSEHVLGGNIVADYVITAG